MNQLIEAIYYAAEAHKNHRKKNIELTPYINHLLAVLQILSEIGVTDNDTLCASVLQDTIKDTKITYEDLYNKFGISIANIVSECSDDISKNIVTRKINQIEYARDISISAKLIKMADKLANIVDFYKNSPVAWSDDLVYGYIVWSYMVFKNLCLVCGDKNMHNSKFGNIQLLENKLIEMFDRHGVTNLDEEQLDFELLKYYSKIF